MIEIIILVIVIGQLVATIAFWSVVAVLIRTVIYAR